MGRFLPGYVLGRMAVRPRESPQEFVLNPCLRANLGLTLETDKHSAFVLYTLRADAPREPRLRGAETHGRRRELDQNTLRATPTARGHQVTARHCDHRSRRRDRRKHMTRNLLWTTLYFNEQQLRVITHVELQAGPTDESSLSMYRPATAARPGRTMARNSSPPTWVVKERDSSPDRRDSSDIRGKSAVAVRERAEPPPGGP